MSTDYATLLVDAGEYAGRDDIAQHFDRFLRLAEGKLNRVLRVAEMEVQDSLALTDGDGTLPDDFLHVREVLLPNGSVLNAVALQQLAGAGGWPRGYAIVGRKLSLRPKWSGTISLTYYAAIPPLTPQAPTNWLLAKAPDVYLYGVVEEIAIWSRSADQASAAQSLRVQAMQGLSLLDERLRWGNSSISIGGPTP